MLYKTFFETSYNEFKKYSFNNYKINYTKTDKNIQKRKLNVSIDFYHFHHIIFSHQRINEIEMKLIYFFGETFQFGRYSAYFS